MKKLIALLGGLCLTSTLAIAGEPHAEIAAFDDLDTDGDAKISKSEATVETAVIGSFAMADSDQDGYLSREEFDSAEWKPTEEEEEAEE